MGSSSLITNLGGDVVQHIEYVPFGEVFIEERNSKWNTPYLFNAKELDEETGLYYYRARYYNPRTSVWLSADPIATYNPFEQENFINGQHNGDIYNSFNHGIYTYCYQNPIKLVDPNGKQSSFMDLGYAIMGPAPHQTVINQEAQKLQVHAAKPAAVSVPLSISFFGIGFTGFSLTPIWILKGPDQGFHLFGSASFGLNMDSGNGGNAGIMLYWLKRDERNLTGNSFKGSSTDYSLGYKSINLDYSTFKTDQGDIMDGYGLSISSSRFGPKNFNS